GHTHLELRVLQHLKGLRRRHLVDQVETDEKLRLAGRQRPHRVRFPDLVEQRACHGALLWGGHVPSGSLLSPGERAAPNRQLCFMIDAALLPALEALLAVARTGSVAAAARQRHITSSAVSQQIRRLEAHFGIKLFERAGRGVRLSVAGEAALPVVRELWTGAE